MIVVDTTVLLYAIGAAHPLKEPCARLMEAVVDQRAQATTTIETIQEFTHVRGRRRPRRNAAAHSRDYASLLSPLLEVDRRDLLHGLRLYERHVRLGAFDAVLAAAALRRDAEALVSADRGFADVPGLRAVVPGSADFDALLAE